MPWVRIEDRFPIHRKVAPLDDATFRLHTEVVAWCARETTDGRISAADLPITSPRARPSRVRVLVAQGLWHQADYECPNAVGERPTCPMPGPDGWVIHDYLEYQPTREKVRADLAAKAERTRKWRAGKAGHKPPRDATGDASPNGHVTDHSSVTYAVGDASPSPPRPAPKGGEGTTSPPSAPPAAFGGRAPAGGDQRPDPHGPRCRTCGNLEASAYHRNVCIRSDAIAAGGP